MKRTARLLSLLLLICLIFSAFTSCSSLKKLIFEDETESIAETNDAQQSTEEVVSTDPNDPETILIPGLEYTYTEQDYTDFTDLLSRLEKLILTDRSADAETIDPLLEELEDRFYQIATQEEIAYIYYCMDLSNETFSNAYLEVSSASSNAFETYQQFCLRIDQSDAPYRDAFFADWSEEDLDEMRSFRPEMTKLSQANDELLVEYHALSDENFNEGAKTIFSKLVKNNNKIAKLNGYSSYPAYAYEKVYNRDYSPEDASRMHTLIGTYVTALCEQSLARFRELYSDMNQAQRSALLKLVEGNYTDAGNTLTEYLKSYPEESGIKDGMGSLFEEGNAVFTTSEKAQKGAFTGYLYSYERPICYFGPGYHSLYTVTHEMGHYFAFLENASDSICLDLAETQSQGNEWMLTSFMASKLDEKIAQALVCYQLYDATATVILSAVVDAFEQNVYMNRVPGVDYDEIMELTCETFGGLAWLRQNIGDPMTYWKRVVVENPCYYISYSFSMLASMELYAPTETDYVNAQQTYLAIARANPEPGELLTFFAGVGIQSPMEEATYQNLIRKFGFGGTDTNP